LPVILVTTLSAYVMRTLMRLGSARTAKLLCAFVVVVAKVENLLSVGENCGLEAKGRLRRSLSRRPGLES
jgi:hypothetical protein